ncbi:MAG: helix-turn-helix transcriptional regulator [Kordiimonadaceae bacterium]|jgi:transcriptional regulator with XRE-family HTH domain|nr:helix-turn-helix transcriptional regulator [Kordiimonadaceae bacterium]MBT6033138.1 helix-turn-helix transcriptional regulator [Kordiimonadaceae bacterium]
MNDNTIDMAIGASLKELRESRNLNAKQLAENANVSAAMISRIENGQVSPSISTLNALSEALDVPVVSFFRETTSSDHVDFTHVKKGQGITSTRIVNDHSHDYINLASHIRRDIGFEAHIVSMEKQNTNAPTYVSHGVVFMHVKEGKARFNYGSREIILKEGDSLTLDAELNHGITELLTDKFTFLTIKAEKR